MVAQFHSAVAHGVAMLLCLLFEIDVNHHVAYGITRVYARGVGGHGFALHKHGQRDVVGAAQGVHLERHEVFQHAVVSLAVEQRHHAVALLVEQTGVAGHIYFKVTVAFVVAEHRVNLAVVHHGAVGADVVAPAGLHEVFQFDLVLVFFHETLRFRLQVALVAHGHRQIVARELGKRGFVDDGCLADAAEKLVDALGAVTPRHTVEPQRHFHETEPAGVGFLTHIAAVGRRIHLAVVALQRDRREHLLPLGEKLARRTALEHHGQSQKQCRN